MRHYILLVIIVLLAGCSRLQPVNKVEVVDLPQVDESKEEEVKEPEVVLEEKKKEYSLDIKNYEVEFSELSMPEIDADVFAVVANKNALLYPFIQIKNNKDLDKLDNGVEIDLGSIIPIIDTVSIEDTILENHFKFKGDLNYFYKTVIDDKEYLIWGAYLITDIKKLEDAVKLSYNYTKSEFSDKWLTFNGKYNFTSKIKNDLKKDRIAFQKSDDSILKMYLNDSKERSETLFITTDLITSSLKVILYESLKDYEESFLIDSTKELIKKYIKELSIIKKDDTGKNFRYSDSVNRAYNYFLLADLLIEYSDSDINMEELMNKVPEVVISELNTVLRRNGVSTSLLLNREIDYTQFKPKGYYNSSSSLTGYYMAKTWLSSTGFDFNKYNLDSSRIALIIYKIAYDNPDILKLWESINNPLEFLYGDRDSFDIKNLNDIFKDEDLEHISYYMADDNNLLNIIKTESVFNLFSTGYNKESILFNYLSNPGFTDRSYAHGLDLISVLGSNVSANLMKQFESDKDYWYKYETRISELIELISGVELPFYLELVRAEVQNEQSREFYFTEKGKWNQKVLNSSLGFWVDYKDSYLNSNKTDYPNEDILSPSDTTYSIEDYKMPKHFIEPNLELFTKVDSILSKAELLFNNDNLTEFKKINEKIITLVKNEVSLKNITDEDNEFIASIPKKISNIILSGNNFSDSIIEINNNTLEQKIKIAGTDSQRIFIALNDKVSGKRVATGYTYSYYELISDSENIISNNEWSSYKKSDKDKPFWGKSSIR